MSIPRLTRCDLDALLTNAGLEAGLLTFPSPCHPGAHGALVYRGAGLLAVRCDWPACAAVFVEIQVHEDVNRGASAPADP